MARRPAAGQRIPIVTISPVSMAASTRSGDMLAESVALRRPADACVMALCATRLVHLLAGLGLRRERKCCANQRANVFHIAGSISDYRGESGRARARHMCATGLLSFPRPSFGCLK